MHAAGVGGLLILTVAAAPAFPAVGRASARALPVALARYLDGDRTDLQWALTATHAAAAWTVGTGVGVTVATIDTGVDASAPDLRGRLAPGAHLDVATGRIIAGTGTDLQGHGTHVAGIIAADADGHGITGIAPGAQVLPIDVDTGGGDLSADVVADALHWAADHGARVANLSLGFADVAGAAQDVATICAGVDYATSHGVVVVAAAGNDGLGGNLQEAPAKCPGAISVAAVDNTLHAAAWSSFDATVTVSAPGSDIYSTVPVGQSPLRYESYSGTSMASPFVAGVAALLLSAHPDWTPAQVTARLVATAADIEPTGPDPRTGAGVVDPAAAMGAAAPAPTATPFVPTAIDPSASHLDASGRPVYDQVLVHWVPDPALAVTGYRITRWTSSGPLDTVLPASAVRAAFPVGATAYSVTALTAGGDVPGVPIASPAAGQDSTPVEPVTGLHLTWSPDGALRLSWSNPPQNVGHADSVAVSLNGQLVVSRDHIAVPTGVVVPAAAVPPGDLTVVVAVGDVTSLDYAENRAALPARVPFAASALSAGTYRTGVHRYRVDLTLADSRRRACGPRRCLGVLVAVAVDHRRFTGFLDSRGHAVVVVLMPRVASTITLGVTVASRPMLTMTALTVRVE